MNTGRRGDMQIGDTTMFVGFLLLMVIVAGGLASGALVFFGKENDVRGAESRILLRVIQECIAHGKADFRDIYASCDIDKQSLEEYFTLQVLENGIEVFALNKGKIEGCRFIGTKSSPNYPVCSSGRGIYENKGYEITAGSSKRIRRENG